MRCIPTIPVVNVFLGKDWFRNHFPYCSFHLCVTRKYYHHQLNFSPLPVATSNNIILSCYISAFLNWVSKLQTKDHLHLLILPPPPICSHSSWGKYFIHGNKIMQIILLIWSTEAPWFISFLFTSHQKIMSGQLEYYRLTELCIWGC